MNKYKTIIWVNVYEKDFGCENIDKLYEWLHESNVVRMHFSYFSAVSNSQKSAVMKLSNNVLHEVKVFIPKC